MSNGAAAGLADFQIGEELADRQDLLGQQPARQRRRRE